MDRRALVITICFLGALFLVAGGYVVLHNTSKKNEQTIDSYAKCVKAGYPVLESYPSQCRTPDGRVFTSEEGGDSDLSSEIHSYAECVAAGYSIEESSPPRCVTSDGSIYISTNTSGISDTVSEYCVSNGATLEVRYDRDGNKTVLCISDDGYQCEAEAYYDGDCKFGED